MIDGITYANQLTIPVIEDDPQSNFPVLKIVPVESLVPHENHDYGRTIAIQNRLMDEGILRNPPIVAPMQNFPGKYLVLDGANRTNALKNMKVPHILVQIASPGSSGLEISAWNQIVLGISSDALLSIIDGVAGVTLNKDMNFGAGVVGLGSSLFFKIHLSSNENYHVNVRSLDLRERIKCLNSILGRIGYNARLDRTHLEDLDILISLHPDMAGLIIFPGFKFDEISDLAEAGQMIPAGITRFLISPRALRMNYMISDLRSDLPLAEKNDRLINWIQKRVSTKGVRVYSETTIMFDE